jgi:hypothetical protein
MSSPLKAYSKRRRACLTESRDKELKQEMEIEYAKAAERYS